MPSVDSSTPPTPVDPSDTVWYLAYGSNMDPSVLTGRRKIQPIESVPVIVPGYWLSFDITGVPYIEPCFASILKMDKDRLYDKDYALEVHSLTQHGREFVWDESHPQHPQRSYPPVLHGVAHRITHRDWQRIIVTEGGWGHDVPTGYNQIEVDCHLVGSDKHLRAHVLEARPLSVRRNCQPSQRYKNLLTTGARHFGLEPAYQEYLDSIVPYECTGIRAKLGRAVFLLMSLPAILIFVGIMLKNRGKEIHLQKPPPFWAAWVLDKANRFLAVVHDAILTPIFGSGRCSSHDQQALTRKRIEEEMKVAKTSSSTTSKTTTTTTTTTKTSSTQQLKSKKDV